ncbi:MAG: carboxypeptidase-like regulatory domain-containing protein [Bacteroidota bacterium]
MKNRLSLLLILMLGINTLFAQSTLEGSISDVQGTTISSATITLRNINNKAHSKVSLVNATGYFILEDIENGAYTLEVTNEDYEPIIVQNLEFPRDTDQVVGLSFEASSLAHSTATANNKNKSEENASLAKIY